MSKVKQKSLKCLLHYCQKCQLQGEKMVECIRCPKAIHKKCINEQKCCLKRISKRFMICREHKGKAKKDEEKGAIVINFNKVGEGVVQPGERDVKKMSTGEET